MMEFENWKEVARPSYFGGKRDEIQKGYDEKYGKGNWRISYWINWGIRDFDDAIQLYEDAYYLYLKSHPKILDELCKTASFVYDNAESNIDCMGYHDQESYSNHYQDIAVWRSLWRLGRKLEGKELVQIRTTSKHKIGRMLNPSEIPFHLPQYVRKPVLKGWWKSGSVEEYWQSAKILEVNTFANNPSKEESKKCR